MGELKELHTIAVRDSNGNISCSHPDEVEYGDYGLIGTWNLEDRIRKIVFPHHVVSSITHDILFDEGTPVKREE